MNVKEKILEEFKKPEFWRECILESLMYTIFYLVGFISGMIAFLWLVKIIFA